MSDLTILTFPEKKEPKSVVQEAVEAGPHMDDGTVFDFCLQVMEHLHAMADCQAEMTRHMQETIELMIFINAAVSSRAPRTPYP